MKTVTLKINDITYHRLRWLLKKRYGARLADHNLFMKAIYEVTDKEARQMLDEISEELAEEVDEQLKEND